MRRSALTFASIIFIINIFISSDLKSQIANTIVVKVGEVVITSLDIKNEIITYLVINKKELTQENIQSSKNLAVKNLINKSIKKNEINNYKISRYNKKDLSLYVAKVAKNLNTDEKDLKEIFKRYEIDYNLFLENYKTELIWNTLIYSIYEKQININIIEVDNEVNNQVEKAVNFDQSEYKLSEIEISYLEYNEDLLSEINNLIRKESFEAAVRKFSTSASAGNDGSIGWVAIKNLSKQFIKEIKKLKVGEVSPPIISEKTVSIIKVNEIKKKSDIDEEKLKENIINQKKEEKLNLFSRSHFSNLENKVVINFL